MTSKARVRIDWSTLAREAEAMRARAYAPYSKYRVGAALLVRASDGTLRVYRGANVENASYGLCVCAERTAIAAAVLAGDREFVAIAVATEGPLPGAPCGMCRQVIAEFARELPIAYVTRGRVRKRTRITKLLPDAFGPRQLGR